jgi:broad specificity phosphatase PhoE
MTTMYLLRHGATSANLENPYRLQGCHRDLPLAKVGMREAELTAVALAEVPFTHVYSSPLRRAMQTARIIAKPHRLRVRALDELIECDIGRWEKLTWEEIREKDAEALERFERDPARFGYPGGENFRQVAERVGRVLDELFKKHAGQTFLVIGHHVVNRVYLAEVLGLPASRAKRVKLDNCGISVVIRDGKETRVATLNAILHLPEMRAA